MTVRNRLVAGSTAIATVFGGSALGLAAAGPAAATDPPSPYVVSLGDSFISGEGAAYSVHNFTMNGTLQADAVWQTPSGTLSGTDWFQPTKTPGSIWAQIYADTLEGDKPAQQIPGCSRSYSAPGVIGDGWAHKNLACSGATSVSSVNETWNGQQTGISFLSGTKYTVFKPGIDNKQVTYNVLPSTTGTLPNGSTQVSQDRMLEQFAKTNDVKVVALSIGGNDFGFANLVTACALGFLGSGCGADRDKYISTENLNKVTEAVDSSIRNIVDAMDRAGYQPGDWKIVYQDPPMPVPSGQTITIPRSERLTYGCPFLDGDLDWIDRTVYPRLTQAMRDGLNKSRGYRGATRVVQIEGTKTFERHKLCGPGTQYDLAFKAGSGKNPTWADNNGKKTEWVNWINAGAQATGNVALKSTALHPNYWGQRAMSACVSRAVETEGEAAITCEQADDDSLDAQGRPKMIVSKVKPLQIEAQGQPSVESNGTSPGDTLTAVVGDDVFLPLANYDYRYQWLRDGQPISRATDRTYNLREADTEAMISVRVTAVFDDLEESATSTEFGPVNGDISVSGSYVVNGTAKVGSTLTLDDSGVTVTPAGTSTTVQWMRDGQPISGQTGPTYVVQADDTGSEVHAMVNLSKDELRPTAVQSQTAGPVAKGDLSASGKPTISGTAQVGQVLTADTTGVSFTPTLDRLSYQWFRDGTAINGATGETYEPDGDDVGKTLTVKAVGQAAGYHDEQSAASDPTGAVTKGTINVVGTAKFDGEPQIGRPITVNIDDTFSHYPSTPDIEWYLDDVKIPGATGATYVPQASDLGKKLSAKITPTDDGWTIGGTAEVTGIAVAKTKTQIKVTLDDAHVTEVSGEAKVGKTLTAKKAEFDPSDGARTVKWYRDGVEVGTGDTYKLRVADAGKQIMAKTHAEETATSTAASSDSSAVTPVKTDSSTKVSAKQKGKKGKKKKGKRTVRVSVSVAAPDVDAQEVTGNARITVGKAKKTVAIVDGKATATLKTKKGKKKVSVSYEGNEGLNPSSARKSVKLK